MMINLYNVVFKKDKIRYNVISRYLLLRFGSGEKFLGFGFRFRQLQLHRINLPLCIVSTHRLAFQGPVQREEIKLDWEV